DIDSVILIHLGTRRRMYTLSSDKRGENMKLMKREKKHWQLYVMLVLPVAFIVIFHYLPMYGLQLAFKDFSFSKGLWGSPWVGLENFRNFYHSYQFEEIIRNTFVISLS